MIHASASANSPTLSRDTHETMIASASAPSVTAPRLIERTSRAQAGGAPTRSPCLEADRQQRDQDHADDREPEVLLDDGRIAEEEAQKPEAPDPNDAAEDVEREKARIVHSPDAGDERRERAHDRHEAREHDGLAAVHLVEALRPQEMLSLQPPTVLREHARPDRTADEVVRVVADDRGGRQQRQDADDVDDASGRECADGEQQGIARQERRHDNARLEKDDQEQQRVDPGAVRGGELEEMAIDV